MALTATMYAFDIDLADHDRGVYETLALRVARHPSESDEYLVTRVLAYVLEYEPGIEFSTGGLSAPDEPPITVRDLTGVVRTWVEIGWPDAARLHKAAKAAPRVVVYPHRDPVQWLRRLAGERIHRAAEVEVRAIELALIAELAGRLDRRMACALSVSDRELFVAIGESTLTGAVVRHALA
ncbi:MAG TPA: YaeQ family protein [Luteitalea sp.]|nr:YaeQ family protein [Luteitalea sp.]